MKVHVVGGFLGAGKTTLIRTAARHLRSRGERVAIIVNDQGRTLVDTQLCRDSGDVLHEITGGCFCCRYDALESALIAAADAGATVTLAEAVGSCTDLVATVLAPLADRCSQRFSLAPLAVVAAPDRIAEIAAQPGSDDVAFLFRKQLEEADVVLLSRADLDLSDVRPLLRQWNVAAPVVHVSGISGLGLDSWLSMEACHRAAALDIDYERYARAEARLAWFNGRAELVLAEERTPADVLRGFLAHVSSAPVAHVKVTGPDGDVHAALLQRHGTPTIRNGRHGAVRRMAWLVNARVALEPADLDSLLRAALERAAPGASIRWFDVECFSPARPTPTHRYAERAPAATGGSCCAAFYQRADVRQLLGDSFHPGGLALTLQLAEALQLQPQAALLDVACGNGASLRAIAARWPIRPLGVDAAPGAAQGIELRAGDVHALPLGDASVDAVLCECALSTFTDQPGALREMFRVIRPGGRLAVSDMVLEGELPAPLRQWIHLGTCLERALSAESYARALSDAGFVLQRQWDASAALHELLLRIKRNLVAWLASAATGHSTAPPFDVTEVRGTLRQAEAAVRTGVVRYGAFIAQRPAVA